jgi:hypothetical protein
MSGWLKVCDSTPVISISLESSFYLEHGVDFRLRRWALKIMSLLISANKLLALTQSSRLRKLFSGKFVVHVLHSPTTIPYCCSLSSETTEEALDAALDEATTLPTSQRLGNRARVIRAASDGAGRFWCGDPHNTYSPRRANDDHGDGRGQNQGCLPLHRRL